MRENHWLKRFWKFLHEDSWQSWLVSLILLVVLIKFILFPLVSLATGSSLPLVVIESCSLYHERSFDLWWAENQDWYEDVGIEKSDFEDFPYRNGLNKGDIIFVWGRSEVELGDIIIFEPTGSSAAHPIIHRVVSTDPLGTKGDNNPTQLTRNNNVQRIDETNIEPEQVIGRGVARVPYVGWLKLVFFEPFREPEARGLCK